MRAKPLEFVEVSRHLGDLQVLLADASEKRRIAGFLCDSEPSQPLPYSPAICSLVEGMVPAAREIARKASPSLLARLG